MHIANGVDMNDKPYTRYHKHHNQGQRVNLETKIDSKVTRPKPRPYYLLVDMLALWQHQVAYINQYGSQKGKSHASSSNYANSIFPNAETKKTVDDRSEQGKQRYQAS